MQSYDQVKDWIKQQETTITGSSFGQNAVSLEQNLKDQRQLQTVINQHADTVAKAVNQEKDDGKKKSLESAYNNLKGIIEKRIHCLETMLNISKLEQNCLQVSRDLDQRALTASKEIMSEQVKPETCLVNLPGFIATMAQDCVFGLRDNWDWIMRLMKCVDVHLKNASDYHQYFHEIQETEPWLLEDLTRISKCLDAYPTVGDTEESTKKIIEELQEAHISLRQWEARAGRLWNVAVKLVPLPLRIDGVTEPTPAQTLCDYKTAEISVRASEDVLLLDNSNPHMWKVRNGKGQEAQIPSVTVLIPGPDRNVIEAAVRLQLQLLAGWTNAVKRIGAKLISYMLLTFKPDYNPNEIASLTSVHDIDKQTLLSQLTFIEDTLKKHWADHDGFISLQERILALRMVLEEAGEGTSPDENLFKSLYLQITTLGKLTEIYQAMFKDWEKFKVALETSQAPELMLIVDKWQQLQFVTRDFFAKFWKTTLPLEGMDQTLANLSKLTIDGVTCEDTVDMAFANTSSSAEGFGTASSSGEGSSGSGSSTQKRMVKVANVCQLGTAAGGGDEGGSSGEGMEEVTEITELSSPRLLGSEHEGTDFGIATERRTAETEQLLAAEMEEKKTFTIKSVINPTDLSEISLQQAIMLGVIRPNEGIYVNSVTGESKPIPSAMSEGLIKVMFSTTKRSQEKTSSVGIITVKTIRETSRPYNVTSVKDTKTGNDVTPAEAVSLGILDEHHTAYLDRLHNKRLLVAEAAEAGFIKIEYIGEAPEPEVVSKTYAVRAVVDRRAKKTITFHEAVKRGIIVRDSGAFKDTLTGDQMYVGDAIMRGFLKARIIEDASGLDIDPENTMVVDKTEKIRKRLLKPLGVISAFKLAAAAAASPTK